MQQLAKFIYCTTHTIRICLFASAFALGLVSCGGGGSTSTPTYTVGGTVSGLTSGTLVLKNNNGDDLTISANITTFNFATAVASGTGYAVTVATQPIGLTCSVSDGTSTAASANVTNVTVTCAVTTHTVGGTVSGLASGTSVVLQVNSLNPTTVSANGSFTFSTPLANTTNYVVTVATQPSGLTCSVSSGSGTIASANVTNVVVACVPPWIGTKQLGVAGQFTLGQSVATDSSGNVYVAGYTQGGLDGNTLTGTIDFFVTKYNSSGVKQYTRQLGVAGQSTQGESVATDANGNVYVAGYTTGGLDSNTRTGTTDFFVTKYNSSGDKQYTRQMGVAGQNTYGRSVATDASGNVYVAGYTTGGLDSNTRTGTTDFFVTKYNSSGVKQYTRQLGVTGQVTEGGSVATDASGNVYVAGYTDGALDGSTQTGNGDFFVTKYNSSGVKQYTRQLGVTGQVTEGGSVATDASGNVYVAGYTDGALDGSTQTGNGDFFVTKYNSSGVKQYTRQLGVTGQETAGKSVATDASGNVYVAGYTSGGLDGSTQTGNGDFFVTKYNSSGVKQYTRQLGVTGQVTEGESVATDASGNVYVAGYNSGGIDGNARIGTTDFFVTKYNSSGVKQYTRQMGVTGQEASGKSVATDASGNVYVVGSTYGGLDGNTLTGTIDFFVTKYSSSGVKQ